jgi:oxaloacetate decarboxylase beta subunit
MDIDILQIFPGLATLLDSEPQILFGRIFLILLGGALIYLGRKGVLEGLLMIPMGLGMSTVNAAVLFFEDNRQGTLFLDPLVDDTETLITTLQIDWLQPIYTFTFSNGLIACLIFLGIGVLLDVGYVMARPFTSMFIALCAELGTLVAFPLAYWLGLPLADAAAASTIGGADGPMILFTALILSEDLFVPITVVAYLYLALTYGGYPYLIRLMVPRRIRGLKMPVEKTRAISSGQKLTFAVIACVLLSLLFPVAAPLFFALFLGVIVRESGLTRFAELLSGPVLYGATFFLGLLLGVLCEARTILEPQVLLLLMLGILALTVAGIGGILGGYVLYFVTGRKFNPVIGIAGVSCLPTTAKVAQKTVAEVTPDAVILPHALGASISGVITSAVFAGILIAMTGG